MEGFIFPLVLIFLATVLRRSMRDRGPPRIEVPPGARSEAPKITAIPDGFAPWKSRLVRVEPAAASGFATIGIDVCGRFPIESPLQLVLAASLFDVTEGPESKPHLLPVLSNSEQCREPGSLVFHAAIDLGAVDRGTGFLDWAPTIGLVPDLLVPPDRGVRRFRVLFIAYDAAHPPTFRHGHVKGEVLWATGHDFTWEYEEPGYRFFESERMRTEILIMEFALAAVDPNSDHGETRRGLDRWIEARLKDVAFDPMFDRPARLREALDDVYARADGGKFDLEDRMTELLKSHPENRKRAIELAFDLLLEREELDGRFAELLELGGRLEIERAELQAMIDKRAAWLSRGVVNAVDLAAMLGIDPEWDEPRVRAHLATLYMQWNSRAESLADPAMRAEAEQMLERIARFRAQLPPGAAS